jgi:uncharacterized delta-60 repeat protein
MVCLILNNYSSPQNAETIIDLGIETTPNISQEKEWVDVWDKYDRDYGHGVAINNITGNIYITGYNLTAPPGGWPDGVLLSMYSSSGVCLWNKTWDPAGYHRSRDISIDSQGYVYVAGTTDKEGDNDVLLIKFDQNGNEIWNVTWDGGESDFGWALFIDKDDYIYVTGYSYNGGDLEDIVVLKYDSSSGLEWSDVWGGTGFQRGYDVAVDSMGYVYITGYINLVMNDILIVKYNNSGDFEDYRIVGPSNDDQGKSIAIDSNDNICIAGYTNLTGNHNIIILKYDSDLNSQWFRNWGLTNNDEGYGIAIDSNDNIYVGGFTTAPDLDIDVALLKYNSVGNYQWNFTWNATSDSDIRDWCRNIVLDSSDNIYLVGETLDTSVFPVLSDMFLLKITQESEPSNGDGNGFEIPGYELFVFTTTTILVVVVITRKFKKN